MIIVILLFSVFIMEILLEEISNYLRCTESLEKHKAELELMQTRKKFEAIRGHLAAFNNPSTNNFYEKQLEDIENLEAQCKHLIKL